jgi:8-oxo-dGTP diphosphatase
MIEVVAAIIYYKDKILCFQKPKGRYKYTSFKYEFPGGKVEPEESLIGALRREIQEELCVDIVVHNKLITIEHTYPDFSIKMHCYKCEIDTLNIVMNEHVDLKLLTPSELKQIPWVEADIQVVDLLMGG